MDMEKLEELKEQYWRTVAQTRKSGRIAGSVKERIEKDWKRFDEDVVCEALRIHINRYKGYKENYTIGIMRNLQRQKDQTGKIGTENRFNRMEQNDYDFEQLEKELLAN